MFYLHLQLPSDSSIAFVHLPCVVCSQFLMSISGFLSGRQAGGLRGPHHIRPSSSAHLSSILSPPGCLNRRGAGPCPTRGSQPCPRVSHLGCRVDVQTQSAGGPLLENITSPMNRSQHWAQEPGPLLPVAVGAGNCRRTSCPAWEPLPLWRSHA